MILDILVMGLIAEQGTYFRNWYNWLHFLSVFSSLILYSDGLDKKAIMGFSAIKKVRPFKLCQIFNKLKLISDGLVLTLPGLRNNTLSLIGVMLFYAVLGLHLFMKGLGSRCRLIPEPMSNGSFPLAEEV